eukprot:gene17943-biopygen17368
MCGPHRARDHPPTGCHRARDGSDRARDGVQSLVGGGNARCGAVAPRSPEGFSVCNLFVQRKLMTNPVLLRQESIAIGASCDQVQYEQ